MEALQKLRTFYLPKIPKSLRDIQNLQMQKDAYESEVDSDVKCLLPYTQGQPFLYPVAQQTPEQPPLRVGVVFSGGQAAGGHNVITGLYDALQKIHPESTLIGFIGGPSGIINCHMKELSRDIVDFYRNQGGFDMIGSGRTKIETEDQFVASAATVKKLNLDGIVIIGGDDSNTNAALLAEYFFKESIRTCVIGVPKTIDGDLKNQHIEISFGFDTATKTYSDIIGNIARDALSAAKYYFFIKIMGRSASHVALECALNIHPNYTLISEEVLEQKKTIQQITSELCDVICERSGKGKDYGVIIIPEGLVEFIPEVKTLIQELNDLLAKKEHENALAGLHDQKARTKYLIGHLSNSSSECYQTLPESIQIQLILDRDPHGNIQVSKIETERLFIELVREELQRRKQMGLYKGKFNAQPYFCGYEGRSCFPSNFDAQYCYALGIGAALLLKSKANGYMSCIQNLASRVEDWQLVGVPIATMMILEKRKGKLVPVIGKSLVNLQGKIFQKFADERGGWAIDDDYQYPGPIQFFGPKELTDCITHTLARCKI